MKGNVPDKVMRDIFRRGKAGEGSACADEGAVAAYLEGTLTLAERSSFEQHASVCPDCQELIGLAIKMSEEAAGAAAGIQEPAPAGKTVLFRLSIPVIGLAVAGFFIVAGALVFHQVYKAGSGAPAVQVADSGRATLEAAKPEASLGQISPAKPDDGGPMAEKAKRMAEAPVPAASVASLPRPKAPAEAPPAKRTALKAQVSAESDAAIVAQKEAAVRPAAPSVPPVNEPVEERTARQGAAPAAAVGAVGGIGGAPSRSEARYDEVRLAKDTPAKTGGEVRGLRTALSVATSQEKGGQSTPLPDPRQVLLGFAAEAETGAKDEAATQSIGDRVFHARGTFWVDQKCADLQNAEIVRIARDSGEFKSVVEHYPGLRRLLEHGKSVLLSWEGKVYFIR